MKTRILLTVSVFTVLLVTGLAGFAQRPSIGGYTVYYGSLHNHSNVSSDALGTPTQAYNYARDNAKLDFFGLSDHAQDMTSSEWDIVKSAANTANVDGNFAAFYGFEWTSIFNYGHVTVVGTDDYCSTGSPTNNFTGLLAWINARNGIAFFNHPGWDIFASNEFNKFTNTPSDKFVGMELWNDKDGFSKYFYNNGFYSNDGGKNYFDEALARGWKVGAAGGDDNHKATWGNATPWRVGVLANSLTRSDILEAFRARRIFSTLDKNLSLSFTINGAQMGSTVSTSSLNIVIDAQDADAGESFKTVVIMKNGVVFETINLSQWTNPIHLTRNLTGVNNDYFYVKVTETDGNEAISSPIFISGPVNNPPIVALSSPENNAVFSFGELINITATASDADGIAKVEFFQGTTKLGESIVSPYTLQWTPTVDGNYALTAKAIDNFGATAMSPAVNITVSRPPVTIISSSIGSGIDDAEETSKGVVNLSSDDIDLVYDTKSTGNQIVGLMFRNLQIPQGAVITSASIQFKAKTGTNTSCSLTIYGQAADNAADFSPTSKNLSSRTKTTASVVWSPVSSWTSYNNYSTPDIKSILQEVVNRSGWTTTSNLAIIIKGTGARIAYSYESLIPAANMAIISVQYYTTTKSASIEPVTELLPGEITIYPNPVTDRLILKVSGETKVERIMIYSISGSLIKEMANIQKQPETTINCSSFTPGIYVMRVQTSKGSHSFRFVKQ